MLREQIEEKYRIERVKIYIHHSVVISKEFDALLNAIPSLPYDIYIFSSAQMELTNYLLWNNNPCRGNVEKMLSLIASGRVKISDLSVYDITSGNKNYRSYLGLYLVIFGDYRMYADFILLCAKDFPIDVMLLSSFESKYNIEESEKLKVYIAKEAYTAIWNKSSYTYRENIANGSTVYLEGNLKKPLQLREKISDNTGEGVIYKTSEKGYLCKIYHKTVLQRGLSDKLDYLIRRRKYNNRIAWPLCCVTNAMGQALGFVMKEIIGFSMYDLMFAMDEKQWLSYVLKVGYLVSETIALFHSQRILVGDISPKDIIFDKGINTVKFIDADSFQYDNYPCPGFLYEYKYKDLHLSSLKDCVRPYYYEDFSLAVLLFQFMTNGHFPNSVKMNIKNMDFNDLSSDDYSNFDYANMDFPFTVGGYTDRAPDGVKKYWTMMPMEIQKLFVDEFTYRRLVTASEWQTVFAGLIKKHVRRIK